MSRGRVATTFLSDADTTPQSGHWCGTSIVGVAAGDPGKPPPYVWGLISAAIVSYVGMVDSLRTIDPKSDKIARHQAASPPHDFRTISRHGTRTISWRCCVPPNISNVLVAARIPIS